MNIKSFQFRLLAAVLFLLPLVSFFLRFEVCLVKGEEYLLVDQALERDIRAGHHQFGGKMRGRAHVLPNYLMMQPQARFVCRKTIKVDILDKDVAFEVVDRHEVDEATFRQSAGGEPDLGLEIFRSSLTARCCYPDVPKVIPNWKDPNFVADNPNFFSDIFIRNDQRGEESGAGVAPCRH